MNTNKRERQTRHLVPDVAPSLDDLAATANHEHIMCTNASRTAVTHAITAGVALLSAREIVATGEWARWCERNFKGSYRTAIAYMRFATYRDHLQSTMTWAEAQAATSGLPDIRPRGGAVQYEDDLRAHAVALAREGRPQSEVAERLGVSQPSVSRWLDPDKRRRQNAASRALREKQRAALAATEREQEIKRAVRKAGAALSEAYSMSARMAKVLAQAEAEATTAEARAALADATGHYHRMQDAIVRALGVS